MITQQRCALLCQYSIPLIFPQVILHMVPLNYQIWHLYIQLCPLMMYRMKENVLKFPQRAVIYKQVKPSGKEILQKLAAEHHDLAETFPNLSMIANKIILVCPLSTASVEHSFSTMNRICNRLRQRILPENLAYCMKVTTEGPKELTDQQAALIARK